MLIPQWTRGWFWSRRSSCKLLIITLLFLHSLAPQTSTSSSSLHAGWIRFRTELSSSSSWRHFDKFPHAFCDTFPYTLCDTIAATAFFNRAWGHHHFSTSPRNISPLALDHNFVSIWNLCTHCHLLVGYGKHKPSKFHLQSGALHLYAELLTILLDIRKDWKACSWLGCRSSVVRALAAQASNLGSISSDSAFFPPLLTKPGYWETFLLTLLKRAFLK